MKHTGAHYDLHAYLDGELSGVELQQFEQELLKNPDLKAELLQLRENKVKIAAFYQNITPPPFEICQKTPVVFPRYKTSLVASLLVGVLMGLGGFSLVETSKIPQEVVAVAQTTAPKFMLHLDSKDPVKMQRVLLETQQLLQSSPSAAVEIIANYQGIQLFDTQSKSRAEIESLLSQYNNLRLVACQHALERAKTEGQAVQLIKGVQSDKAAIDEVVDRLREGWTYIKI